MRGDVSDGLPENARWREEITRDAYLLFYELVPGDAVTEDEDDALVAKRAQYEEDRVLAMDCAADARRTPQELADQAFAAQTQAEEDHIAALADQVRSGIDSGLLRPFGFWPGGR